MAQNLVYPITKSIHCLPVGHKVRHMYHLDNLATKLSCHLAVDFITDCTITPTSFKFELTFHHVPDSGIVNIPFSIKRRDSLKRPMHTILSVKIFDGKRNVIYQPSSKFEKSGVKPGDSIRENFTSTPLMKESIAVFNDKIYVVEFSVLGCHGGPIAPFLLCSKL